MVLSDAHDQVRFPVGSPIGPSNHSALLIDVVLEQLIPHLLCRQEVYLKNSLYFELVSGDLKGLDWHEIIRSPYLV